MTLVVDVGGKDSAYLHGRFWGWATRAQEKYFKARRTPDGLRRRRRHTAMITRMSEEEARALLRAGRLARLGCVAEGYPYVVPVNYVYDGEFVFSHSLPGLKIEAMRASPRVCLQVDEMQDETRWTSVLAFGTFEELKDKGERESALSLLLSLFPQLTPVESFIIADAAAPTPVVYRVRVERVTGVREE
jgi:uncharacterized protein